MKNWTRFWQAFGIVLVVAIALFSELALAIEVEPPKPIADIKKQVEIRAGRNEYPCLGLKASDVQETLARINSTDPDEWATEWMKTGDSYALKAKTEEAANLKAARDDYFMAFRYYMFGRFPVPSSPKKAESYAKSTIAFANYARLEKDLKIEIVKIPFEGGEIVGCLQKPLGTGKAPILVNIGGVDMWKETMLSESQGFVKKGLATLSLDMPGTGQAPVPLKPGSERMFSAVIDYLLTRQDVDGSRIVMRGVSFGSYWALRAGYREPNRIKGIVYQSAPVHNYFQREWIEKRGLKSPYYLFDYVQSRLYITRTNSVEELANFLPSLSLLTEGLVSKPSPPMLVVAGVKDPQAPWVDALILLENGSPKDAWVNPTGSHMGITDPTGSHMGITANLDEEAIMEQVVFPWILRRLGVSK
jgi:esterase FrsA